MGSSFSFVIRREFAIARRQVAWRGLYTIIRFFPSHTRPFRLVLNHLKELNKTLNTLEKGYRKKKLTSLPTSLLIDTTSRCQLKCKLCFRQHHTEDLNQKEDISVLHMEKIINELFPTAQSICLTLTGEPLLSSHLERITRAAQRYNVKIGLITNGMLLDKVARQENLLEALGSVEISLDSLQPELFEELRKNACYNKLMQNIDLIKSIRTQKKNSFYLSFSVTLLNCNIAELPAIINFASKVGGNCVRCCLGVIYDQKDAGLSILNNIDIYNEIRHQCIELAREKNILLLMPDNISDENHQKSPKTKEFCTYIYDMVRIRNDGIFTSCLHSDPPFEYKINETTIKKIWNCREMQVLRRTYDRNDANPSCRDCYIISRDIHSKEFHEKQLHYFNYSKKVIP